MRKHKNKIITGIIIAFVLAFVFWYGGDAPALRGWIPEPKEDVAVVQNDEPVKEEIEEAEKSIGDISVKEENAPAREGNKPQKQDGTPVENAESIQPSVKTTQSNEEYSKKHGMVINEVRGKDQYRTDPVPEGKPVPIEPENSEITDKKLTCILTVRCDTILNNISWLDSKKVDIVPKDGVIFAEKTVTFYEGESVFNVLAREMKRNKIHLEFANTPIYNSAYIEGIANLYEFDCGELSGWMYKVNDWFPNYGCSRYQLKAGDKVEWVYTCDLGNDVGGHYSARNGR